MDNDNVEKVLAVIRQNCHLTVRGVAEKAGISKSACHLILTDKLKMRRVATKFVLLLLKNAQNNNRVTVRSCLIVRILIKTFCKMS
jgi:hypothetical protein